MKDLTLIIVVSINFIDFHPPLSSAGTSTVSIYRSIILLVGSKENCTTKALMATIPYVRMRMISPQTIIKHSLMPTDIGHGASHFLVLVQH